MSWENNKPINLRQRLAVKLLLLAVKIVEPYEYSHQFSDEWAQIEELLGVSETTKQGGKKS